MKKSEKDLVAFRLDPKTKKQFQLKLLKNDTNQQQWLEEKVLEYLEDEKSLQK